MKKSKTSLMKKIFVSILLVMLLQAGLLYSVTYEGGSMEMLRNNAFQMFNEKVNNRKNILENEMLGRWSNLTSTVTIIEEKLLELSTEKEHALDSLEEATEFEEKVLSDMVQPVLSMIRRNMVSGGFLILEGNEGQRKSGIYFRAANPQTEAANNSDLLALRAPAAVTKKYNIAFDSMWEPYFSIDEDGSDYYNQPFGAAMENEDLKGKDAGYWSKPFYLSGDEERDSDQIITYSMPLLVNGTPVGVLGVEISLSYLGDLLPYRELNQNSYSSYILAVQSASDEEEKEFIPVMTSGSMANRFWPKGSSLPLKKLEGQENFYSGESRAGMVVYANAQSLSLYNSYTPFEQEHWMLVGVISENHLLSFFEQFRTQIFFVMVLCLILGIFGTVVASKLVTNPISHLITKLKAVKPGRTVELEEIGVREIDELSSSIVELSREVENNATRTSAIMEMAGISVGACEYKKNMKNQVFCSQQFGKFLGMETENTYLSVTEIKKGLRRLKPNLVERNREAGTFLFKIQQEGVTDWLRMKVMCGPEKILAIIVNVTKELEEKIKIEHDRDYDLLTNLLNRRAFQKKVQELFEDEKRIKQGAMVMIDLDNLKHVNDTYGHDYGDEYIRITAKVLKNYEQDKSIISRMSGDEFLLFFFGYKTQEEIRVLIQQLFEEFNKAQLHLPDGTDMKIRASAGMAFYPQDSKVLQEILNFADFAMYSGKKTAKGMLLEFDAATYKQEAYLLQCKEELNIIIEKQLVDYMFQPIVSGKTGEIFAYEALMRPKSKFMKGPEELLKLANSQSKLHAIEHLTMMKSLKSFEQLAEVKRNCKIFINSIANQILKVEDIQHLESLYPGLLSSVVVEITEEERMNEEIMQAKRKYIEKWGAGLAIDDFGSGYNSEAMLLTVHPDYIKIDRSMIQDVHKDAKKQIMFRHFLVLAEEYGIATIAEGVETEEEMKFLVKSGVDYLQGYYLGRPQYQLCEIEEKIQKVIVEIAKQE